MPFCANCGSDVQGKFCAKCGTPIAAAPPAPAYTPPAGPPPGAAPYNPAPPGGYAPPPPQPGYAPTPPGGGYNPPPPGGGYAPPPPGGGYPGGGYAPPPAAPQAAGLEENMASALCYLLGWLTGVLFLVLEPYNRNKTIRFHAFQSIFLSIAWIVVYIVILMISGALLFVPFVGPIISMLLHLVIFLGLLGLWIFMMYKAYNRERFVIPIIGPLAEKQA